MRDPHTLRIHAKFVNDLYCVIYRKMHYFPQYLVYLKKIIKSLNYAINQGVTLQTTAQIFLCNCLLPRLFPL